jgi:putative membrane protein
VLNKFKAPTLAGLTGFVIGSLAVIWPWKTEITRQFEYKVKVTGYEWNYPVPDQALFHALLLMLAGAGLVLILDRIAGPNPASTKGNTK